MFTSPFHQVNFQRFMIRESKQIKDNFVKIGLTLRQFFPDTRTQQSIFQITTK